MTFRKPFRAVPIQEGKRHRKKRRRKEATQFALGLGAAAFVGVAIGLAILVIARFWPTGIASQAQAMTPEDGFTCQVSSITDGDTLRCSDGTRVRLHAVAARESDETCRPGHPCPNASGADATAKLTELAMGQTLQCEQTGTSYNRVTAICRNENRVEINCAMIESGKALVWPRFNAERPICH